MTRRSSKPQETAFEADAESGDGHVSALPAELLPHKPSDGGLQTYDPMRAYMRDVQRYALLKPEEEKALAMRYFDHGDVEAARHLVTANLRLVVKIAYEYRRAYRNLLDLVQEGNIGLMHAVQKYDPYKGVKLSTYAAWWIRAYMLRFVLNNWRLVKLGTTQAQRKLFFNLQKEKDQLRALGIEPTSEAIAKRLEVSEEDVVSMDRRLASGETSLDAPSIAGDGSSLSRLDMLPAGDKPVDEALAQAELGGILGEEVERFGKQLAGKDAEIFRRRLIADEPATLQELGQEFGVSRERVRQLEQRLLGKLREHLQARVGSGVFDGDAS